MVEQFKINASLARRAIRELVDRKLIKPVAHHSAMLIYTPSAQQSKDDKDQKNDKADKAKAVKAKQAAEKAQAKAEAEAAKAN